MSARMRSLVLPLLLLLPPVPGFDTIEVAWPAELSGPAALEEYPAIEPFAMTARMYATPPQDSVAALPQSPAQLKPNSVFSTYMSLIGSHSRGVPASPSRAGMQA